MGSEPTEYPHLAICNGDRRYPAGIPGHCCCCFNISTEYLQMVARGIRSTEQLWRKLLWSNHARYLPFEHTPYGDDGEMQCCGIDFKRMSAEEIDKLLVERSLAHIMAQKRAEEQSGACNR